MAKKMSQTYSLAPLEFLSFDKPALEPLYLAGVAVFVESRNFCLKTGAASRKNDCRSSRCSLEGLSVLTNMAWSW